MSSYKQIVFDIKDYISFELGRLEREFDRVDTVQSDRIRWQTEKQTLEDILDIIVREGGK